MMSVNTIFTKDTIFYGNLLLVNAAHALQNTEIDALVPAHENFPDILLKPKAAYALQLALKKINAMEEIVPVSGYRCLQEQVEIYENSLKANGEAFTKKYVALPNKSEHQTGLAIDLGLRKENIDFICPDFPYEGICQKFRQLAPSYGFIERYAKDKESVTGISHEPWHFRYVGYPHSQIITEKGLAFEEYISYIKSFGYNNRYLYQQGTETEIEIYYVPVSDGKSTIYMPATETYEISGNNIDGIIVTIWRRANEEEWKLYRH